MKKFWWYVWLFTLTIAVSDFIYVIFIRKELFDKTRNIFALIFIISLILSGISFLIAILTSVIRKNLKNKMKVVFKKINNVSLVNIGVIIGFILNLFILKNVIALFNDDELKINSQNTTPTIISVPTPIPTISAQNTQQNNYQYVQPTIDPDPLITCSIHASCGGGSRQMKKSECNNMNCCLINQRCGGPKFITIAECNNSFCCLLKDGTGKLLTSKNACNNYYSNNTSDSVSAVPVKSYYSCYLCYHYSSGDQCKTYNNLVETKAQCDAEQAEIDSYGSGNSYVVPTTAPAPTFSPEEEQAIINSLADTIQKCWDGVNATYDQRVHNCNVQFGGSSAAEACAYLENQNRQKDLNACKGR